MRTMIIGLVTLALSGAVMADEVVLTSSNSKNGTATAIDFSTDGSAAGVQINLALPANAQKGVDLSRLKVSVGDFQLASAVNGNEVVILVFSPSNATLPKGVISLGNLSVLGGAVSVKAVVAANAKAELINTTSRAQ